MYHSNAMLLLMYVQTDFLARFPLDDICCCKSADKCSTRPSETRHLLLVSSDPQPRPGSLRVDSICFENIGIMTNQGPKYQQSCPNFKTLLTFDWMYV